MDYYRARFGEMDDARKVRSRLRAAYARNGNHPDVKLVKKAVIVPETALATLEIITKRLDAACRISRIKK